MKQLKQKIKNRLLTILASTRQRILGKHGFAILCETAQGIFAVDPEDVGVGGELLKTGIYGEEELESILSEFGKDDQILIVGAHIGTLVIPIARLVRSVHCVEANPDTFRLLDLNVSLNCLTNVEISQIAASDKRETLTFLKNRVNSGGSKRMPRNHNDAYFYDSPEIVEVDAFPLDARYDLTFQHIVMDIEGSEVFALRGMPRILAGAKSLRIEFLPHHLRDVAGVSVAQFLEPIKEHFNQLVIPSRNLTVGHDSFLSELQSMFDRDVGDNSIIFRKMGVSRSPGN